LEYEQVVPEQDLVVHFELERAPGASAEFFVEPMMSQVALSHEANCAKLNSSESQSTALRVLRTDWAWGCDVPVTSVVSHDGSRSGLLYVNCNGIMKYAIKYEIHVHDRRINSDSDVWMGCLSIMGNIQGPPLEGQIPFCEWFDWRPLPEITGPNSTDPRILGILDHRPDFQRPTDDPPKSDPPNDLEQSRTANPE
jgi:hypothetical protein